ncbi:MAG TPA: dihydrofolate reductase [Thermoanaerobaculia bacterium]|nr:dihydrofolate reductase [Thermoanaerobaculia bacterium]
MTISVIAAVSANGIIGRGGALPWRQSADLKRFKALTMGHHVIMGRKTFDEVGRPLPGRPTIVVTRNRDFTPAGTRSVGSLEEALALAENDPEVFIVGGGEIYVQALPRAGRLYLTRIHAEVEGDTQFPEIDASEWRLIDSEHCEADENNQYPYSFLTYERARPSGHLVAEYTEAG